MAPLPIPGSQFAIWSLDFIVGLPSDKGYNAILTVVDMLTKLVKLVPYFMGNGELFATTTVKLFFDKIVCSFGIPQALVHDRDPWSTSSFWSALFEMLSSRVVLSSAFYPQMDG